MVSRYVLVGILRAPRLTCLIHSAPKCLCIPPKDNKNYQVSETMDRRGPEAHGGDSTCTFLIMHSSSTQLDKLHCSGKHSPSSRMSRMAQDSHTSDSIKPYCREYKTGHQLSSSAGPVRPAANHRNLFPAGARLGLVETLK